MSLLPVFWDGLKGFDWIILLAAAANGVVCHIARREALKLYNTMHQSKYVPSWRGRSAHLADSVRAVDEEGVIAMRNRSERLYSIFINITAVFPLLGILIHDAGCISFRILCPGKKKPPGTEHAARREIPSGDVLICQPWAEPHAGGFGTLQNLPVAVTSSGPSLRHS